MPQSLSYPSTPENVDPQILQPSPEFKHEATKVLAAILFFIVTYLVLVTAAFALAALCAIGGVSLVVLKPAFFTLMIGIGLAGLGLMVVFFLIKFLFKRHKVDRSGLTEITENEHPRLFEFIRTLANETQTPFPKRIYLSADVNASVFYDSSFLSMFLPVKKNLQIGLGLVNSVNVSEFKAIVAHEFGHFSQRSMKLGSYVYNMNHIIFNMLYDNEGYQGAIERWANASGYFAFFAALTIRIVNGIQWILQQVYAIVNKIYMSLSRQMEFHADTVSASVSGGNHLISSLRRLEIAEMAYNNVFGFYQEGFKEGLKAENIYPQHREAMLVLSKLHDLPMEHGLPQVDANSFARFNKSRVVIKDQWASHPSTDDRETHLRSLNIETPPQHDSAWSLFDGAEQLQQQMTHDIFQPVKYESPVTVVNEMSFRSRYEEKIKRYQLPSRYKGFFDSRNITSTDAKDLENRISIDNLSLDQILTDHVLALPYQHDGLLSDSQTLAAIAAGNTNVKNFDFNGKKFKAKDASALQTELENELRETRSLLAEADRKLIAWFLKNTANSDDREKLRTSYHDLFQLTDSAEKSMQTYAAMQQCLAPLYQVMQFNDITRAVERLKQQEVSFRKELEQMLADTKNDQFIDEPERKRAKEFLGKVLVYFFDQTYNQPALDHLNECLYLFYRVINERAFHTRAELLRLQLELTGLDKS